MLPAYGEKFDTRKLYHVFTVPVVFNSICSMRCGPTTGIIRPSWWSSRRFVPVWCSDISVIFMYAPGVLISSILVYWYPVYWCTGIQYTGVLISSILVYWYPVYWCTGIQHTGVLISSILVHRYPVYGCTDIQYTGVLVSSILDWYPVYGCTDIQYTGVLISSVLVDWYRVYWYADIQYAGMLVKVVLLLIVHQSRSASCP